MKSLLLGTSLALAINLTASAAPESATAPLLPVPENAPKSAADWMQAGRSAIAARLKTEVNTRRAKNVILFVGDGMGISTLTAGRIYEGQLRGESGEEGLLSFEAFPYTALVKTYNVDAQVADSAGTASALNTGSKTLIGAINTAPHLGRDACPTKPEDRLTPLAALAEAAGMATGIVSTTRLTHATPAAVYAVASYRNWENDSEIPDHLRGKGCQDIASQITGDLGGNGLEIALGGGRSNFLPKEGNARGKGRRTDGRDIIQEWVDGRDGARYVANRSELLAARNSDGPILGLFTKSHLAYDLDRDPEAEPSLAEMTEIAIERLSQASDEGFYLMVEGGRIDHAHHGGNAQRAMGDVAALSAAVRKAMQMVDLEETLILVTADHSHVFTIAGYPPRGNPLFGLVRTIQDPELPLQLAQDEKPYTTLGYMNGPGAVQGERPHLHEDETEHLDFKQQSLVPLYSETHGGEDVALFGIGPWAHLVRGTMEQNVVFHIMHHALQLEARGKD